MTLSINTNTAAMAALESLSQTTSALNMTENEVSTGKKVSSAADNPAIYAISQAMTGNISGLSAVSDSLSLGAQVVNTASTASQDIVSALQTLQQTVTQAGQTGIDQPTMENQVAAAINQINNIARGSTFNDVNLLTSSQDAGLDAKATLDSNGSSLLNVVTGTSGQALSVGSQLTATDASATATTTLSDALGLTNNLGANGTATAANQTVLNAGGINITAAEIGTLTTNLTLTNSDGSTTSFTLADGTTNNSNKSVTAFSNATPPAVTGITVYGSYGGNPAAGAAPTSTDIVQALNNNGYNAVLESDGSIDLTGKGVSAAAAGGTDLGASALTASQAATTNIQVAINKMTTISSTLGQTTQQITGMQSFTSDLSDALTTGVGGLTDADLSSASAQLTSLQTKQQLAIQSLSIANSQSQSILSLFRG